MFMSLMWFGPFAVAMRLTSEVRRRRPEAGLQCCEVYRIVGHVSTAQRVSGCLHFLVGLSGVNSWRLDLRFGSNQRVNLLERQRRPGPRLLVWIIK